MNSCHAIRRQLTDQCSPTSLSELDSPVADHIQQCAGCRRYAEELNSVARDLVKSSISSEKRTLSPRVLWKVARAVRSPQKHNPYIFPGSPIAISGLAVVITFLLLGGVFSGLHRTRTNPEGISAMHPIQSNLSPNLSEFAVVRLRHVLLDSFDELEKAAVGPLGPRRRPRMSIPSTAPEIEWSKTRTRMEGKRAFCFCQPRWG